MSNREFSDLYNKHYKRIVFYASARVNFNAELINELTQNAFVDLLDVIRKGVNVESPINYLRNSVDNQISHLNKNLTNTIPFRASATPLYNEDIALNEIIGLIEGCLAIMPEDMRLVMTHVFYKNDEVSVEDVTELLGIESKKYFELRSKGIALVSEEMKNKSKSKI